MEESAKIAAIMTKAGIQRPRNPRGDTKGFYHPRLGRKSVANRLAGESSPYLLQHAQNPVEWSPWAAEALARARDLDRPIFLSIGYASCHWCHVMAHESFEEPAIAALLNEHFVPIKVDREER